MTEREQGNDSENKIKWTIHDTNPDIVEKVREKLTEVIDPELGLDAIQLGLIRDISIVGETAHLKMMLTTPFCPYGPEMVEFVRIKAEGGLQKKVEIELVPEIWNPTLMEDPSLLGWGLF